MEKDAKDTKDAEKCSEGCIHQLTDYVIREFPTPNYGKVVFLPPPRRAKTVENPKPIGANHWLAPLGVDIPYQFHMECAVVTGILYVRDRPEDTYTEGVITGCANCRYRLSFSDWHIRCDAGPVRFHVLLDFDNHHLVMWYEHICYECCGYRNWGQCERWCDSPHWVIASW